MNKITIYLPLEIKARELSSLILLSKFAVKHNCRVYLGTKSSIRRLLRNKINQAGAFIFKGGLDTSNILTIKKKVDKFVVLDHEMSPSCLNFRYEMRLRTWPGSEKHIDRYYVIGQNAYEAGIDVLKDLAPNIIKTGWPSMDLCRDDYKSLYENDISQIKNKHGEFILFSSAFSYNSRKKITDIYNKNKKHNWKGVRKGLEKEMEWAELTLLEFKKNIEVFRKIDSDNTCPQIIIRPHPSEDHKEWQKIAQSFKKIKVIFEGEILPWIYSSKGLLHRGCASSIPAYIHGVPIGYPILKTKTIKKSLPYELSEHLFGLQDIVKFCKKNINKEHKKPKKYNKKFRNMVHIENKQSSELIIEDLLKLNLTPEISYQANFKDVVYDFFNNIRKKIIFFSKENLKLNQNISEAPQSQKIPGGINKNEISKMLKKVSPNSNFKVTEVFGDCFEIE